MKRRTLARTTVAVIVLLVLTVAWTATSLAATHDVKTETELNDALSTAATGDTIRLAADIDLTSPMVISEEQSITLDLNNRVLRQTTAGLRVIVNAGTLTIKDSASSKTKKYFEKNGDVWSLTKKSTQYSVTGGVVTGGNINDEGDGGAVNNTFGKLTIAGGAFAGNSNVGSGDSRDGAAICNGGEFSMTGGEICYNFATDTGAAIVIYGRSDSNTISGGKIHDNVCSMGGAISVEKYAETKISGNAEIYSNTATGLGGGGIGNMGTLDLVGGKIYKNKSTAKEGGFGGGIGNIGTLNYTGGEIYDNEAVAGGGICNVSYGTSPVLNMKGGKITGNTAEMGGGICNVEMMGTAQAILTAGTISGNKSTQGYGGGVLVMGPTVLGGSIKITGNTGGSSNSSSNNLFLPDKELAGADMTVTISTDKKPSSMSVGVMTNKKPTEGNPVPVTETNDANYSRFFKSDEGYSVVNEDNVVKLMVGGPGPGPVPKTGDDNRPIVFAGLLLLAAAGALLVMRKRNKA